jgi:DNA repair exonuclease SbcCD nuclease subunit
LKFIHAADLHLDSPLRGLERYEGAPAERIRHATRQALEQLVQLAIDEEAALVLLAGDVFDSDWRDYKTGLYFISRMARLQEAGIRVFLVRGNHDALNSSMRSLTLPENVHQFSSRRAETVTMDGAGVAVHGRSFRARQETEDLSVGYPPPVEGLLNIGLLHTSLDGRPGHDVYAPCSVDGLKGKGYDYWALGHVHTRETVAEGAPWIVYPGNLQGRHVRETGAKGCCLVSVEEGTISEVEFRDLSVLRWALCEVDATGAEDGNEVVDRLLAAVDEEAGDAGDRPLAVRCRVTGTCRAHRELADDPEKWMSEARARTLALAGADVWIESIRFETRLEIDLEAAMARDDALGGLLRTIGDVEADDQRLDALSGIFDDLQKKLPAKLARGEDPLDLDDRKLLREALVEARDLLMARLAASGVDR